MWWEARVVSGSIYVWLFFAFLVLGCLWWFVLDSRASQKWPLFGRDIFGAGLFYFFTCIFVIVVHGASNASTLYDAKGEFEPTVLKKDFTLGLFVAMKDVGTLVGIALGFLSLAWGRFFEHTMRSSAGNGAEPATVKLALRSENGVVKVSGLTIDIEDAPEKNLSFFEMKGRIAVR